MVLDNGFGLWNERTRYEFDLNGFIWIKNYFSPDQIASLRAQYEALESLSESELPSPITFSKPRTSSMMYVSNIAELSSEFTNLIKDSGIISVIRATTAGLFRFNHSYGITHWEGGETKIHMGASPLHPKATYQVRDRQIFSSLTKAVIPLDNHTVEDGCFCVVPGSHKSNFDSALNGCSPTEHPNMIPLDASPGDLVVFTEALQHGGFKNFSGRPRRTLYYCYSVGYMPDWTKLGLKCSSRLKNHSDNEIREIVRLKVD